MSVSSAYFPIIFFSSLLYFSTLSSSLIRTIFFSSEESNEISSSVSPSPPVLSSFLLSLLLLFLPFHPSFFLCPSHYPTTLRTERVASFIRCVHRFTARNGKNCSPLISINVYADKRGVNVIKLDRYVPNVSLLRSHSLMHHFIRLLTT